MATAALTLYELAAADAALRFSPHCWKTRMALAHKGLEAERVPWRFTEKAAIAFSGQGMVPVLVHDGETVTDSWAIALHLEQRFPDRPSLFGGNGAMPLARFVNGWADTVLSPAIARIIVADVHGRVHAADRDYFRTSREQRFGQALEDVVADRPANLAAFRRALQPLRRALAGDAFIAGPAPAYADYCVFGMLMWARCISDVELLEPDDPVSAWRDRLLDAFGGLARSAPTARG
ncbi:MULTISPECIES: glutathione S-transferase family protein [Inquilinus]|uniref:Glutathione S-transferase n=1 Tax=Inquilinus ginsengisoli TaxID=363840 RepID=A0ABU1JZ67_9PROT|nr:glutathione S-transferase family protein [Inquilinus ginsengisoli]MDR6293309.1 glutathione S-transferase [Inquilinus ginsengisoli]